MADFKRNKREGFARKSFGNSEGRFGGGRNSDRSDRRGGRDSERSGGSRGFSRSSPKEFGGGRSRPTELQFFEATCARCGKFCEVPFRPTGSKPVLCRNCFQNKDAAPMATAKPGQNNDLAEINRKLDKILRALNLD